jgi:hypothetical protein
MTGCSNGINSVVLLICFSKVMVSLMGPIRACCLGCVTRMLIEGRCVLYI